MRQQLFKRKILLVEDELLIAKLESRLLEKRGYVPTCVYSGEDAIQIIDEAPAAFDLILMDIDLGDGKIDGTEVAAQILSKVDIPLLFLSSHTEPEVVEKTEMITSYGYVVKNSGITILDASIKMAFKLFEAKREIYEKESLLLTIAENFPNSYISIIEKDYTVGFSSGQAFKKKNLDPEMFVGMNLRDVFGELAGIVQEKYKKTFAGEECLFELYINDGYQRYRTVLP